MKYTAIIPARYASSRFPGKPLAMLGDTPVIVRVVRQALKVDGLHKVVVATDDERILECVRSAGYDAVMTRADHRSGTDRVHEAMEAVAADSDVIINIQGDEPFIQPEQIMQLMRCFDRRDVDIATLVRPLDASAPYEAVADPNVVKCVRADNGNALYFSRSVIPYLRGLDKQQWPSAHQYWLHVGMYAYRAEALRRVVQMPPSSLEVAESLEQLRWLQGGMTIATDVTRTQTIGIDTPADLEAAITFLNSNVAGDL